MSSSRQVRIEFRDKIKLKGCDLLGGGGVTVSVVYHTCCCTFVENVAL